jgi:hypothetical protein
MSNDQGEKLIIGSIGSTYTNNAWSGSRYIYSTSGELRIKAASNLRLYSGGLSHTGNLAVTFDSSQNAAFTSTVSTSKTFISTSTGSGNPEAGADQLRVNGYGIIGNRGGIYMTNSDLKGNLQFGIGGQHAQNTRLTIDASASTFTNVVWASGGNSSEWSEAHGWGNHADAGYHKDDDKTRHRSIKFTGEGGDSGNGVENYAIYQAGGAWSNPFPDLVIAMHTGIKIGGYHAYGGTRFYNDAPEKTNATEIFSVGDGDNNVKVKNDLTVGGNINVGNQKGFVNSADWTRNKTPHGYIDFGPANSSHAHIYTDRPGFYFNKKLLVSGQEVYHTGNIPTWNQDTTGKATTAGSADWANKVDVNSSNDNGANEYSLVWHSGDTVYSSSQFTIHRDNSTITAPTFKGNLTGKADYAKDSDKLDGLQLETGRNDSANKVVRTDQNGYLHTGWINTTSGDTTSNITNVFVNTNNDGYIRKASPGHFRSQITDAYYPTKGGTGASGNWNIKANDSTKLGGLDSGEYSRGTSGSFYVGGDRNNYYPVKLQKGRMRGTFMIHRESVHQNSNNYGSGRLLIKATTSGWGHTPLTFSYETLVQSGRLWSFIASNYRSSYLIVMLRGATTYQYTGTDRFILKDGNPGGGSISDGYSTYNATPTNTTTLNASGEYPDPQHVYIPYSNHEYCDVKKIFNGSVTAPTVIGETDVRAPVFYDSLDTTYKLDPNGTSYLKYLGRNEHHSGHLVGSYNNISANSTRTNPIYTIGSNYNPDSTTLSNMYGIGYTNGGGSSFVSLSGCTGWGAYFAADGDVRAFIDAQQGTITSTGSMRAPVFYDSLNTTYKVDPGGTSRLKTLNVDNDVTANNFVLSSDIKLKDNIKKVDNKHIDAAWKTFEMKSDKGQKRYGVIAQELEVKNPEFVRTDEEGIKSVAYIDLLIAKIAELEARLEKAGI